MVGNEGVVGSWTRSHEEDHEGIQVVRPAHVDLPPARGRFGLTLRPDGSAVSTGPGPVDRGQAADGRWQLTGKQLSVDGPSGTASYEVVSADADRLELRPIDRH